MFVDKFSILVIECHKKEFCKLASTLEQENNLLCETGIFIYLGNNFFEEWMCWNKLSLSFFFTINIQEFLQSFLVWDVRLNKRW